MNKWDINLLRVCANVKCNEELKLSVIHNETREEFETKGGNTDLYYDIKGPINTFCYKVNANHGIIEESFFN